MSQVSEHSGSLVLMAKDDAAGNQIGDKQFMNDLGKLKDLRSFLIEQAVQLKPSEASTLSFGKLNLLTWRDGGRHPTQEEWTALETLTQELFRHLSDPLRRRFLYSRLPWWVAYLVGGLGCVAFVSLISCMFLWGNASYPTISTVYIIWLASLGAIGSISFIGMNALSVQDDATFDLSSAKLLILRISLGAMFGVLLTLPFGLGSFTAFLESLLGGTVSVVANTTNRPPPKLTLDSLILLLPFVLGFSTSLVIMILNQCVDALQTLFGKKPLSASPPPPSPPNSSAAIGAVP